MGCRRYWTERGPALGPRSALSGLMKKAHLGVGFVARRCNVRPMYASLLASPPPCIWTFLIRLQLGMVFFSILLVREVGEEVSGMARRGPGGAGIGTEPQMREDPGG